MIHHQFVGSVVKKTETRKDGKIIIAVTAEFPDQVNPEYQYTNERLTFLDNDNVIKLGDTVRIVVMDVPSVTEGEIINEQEYIAPPGA